MAENSILIIVPINNAQFTEQIYNYVQPHVAPDFRDGFAVRNINAGCPCIESRYNIDINAACVIEMAKQAEQEGFQGIFVTDMDMTGVGAIREVVNIPVIGGFRASAYTAMMIAQSFSIVTVSRSVMAMQVEHVKAFGITENFASIRSVDLTVLDLIPENLNMIREKVLEQSLLAIDQDGAQSIILGCTGFMDVAEYVTEQLAQLGKPAPVVDPNLAAVSYLELLIRNNLSQSRLTYFNPPGECEPTQPPFNCNAIPPSPL